MSVSHLDTGPDSDCTQDATLQRCFGVDKKLLDCEWKELEDVRTIREPHEPVPRLEDLIEYLAQPKQANIWLLLDIKVCDT